MRFSILLSVTETIKTLILSAIRFDQSWTTFQFMCFTYLGFHIPYSRNYYIEMRCNSQSCRNPPSTYHLSFGSCNFTDKTAESGSKPHHGSTTRNLANFYDNWLWTCRCHFVNPFLYTKLKITQNYQNINKPECCDLLD